MIGMIAITPESMADYLSQETPDIALSIFDKINRILEELYAENEKYPINVEMSIITGVLHALAPKSYLHGRGMKMALARIRKVYEKAGWKVADVKYQHGGVDDDCTYYPYWGFSPKEE
jgi:hypothetical protein